MCFGKLICALGNCFVFWEIDLCFGKLFCVLVNRFVIDPFGPPYPQKVLGINSSETNVIFAVD